MSIVVGLPGHAGALHTLAWAIAEASVTGAQLVVVHALGSGRAPGSPGSLGALETVDRPAAGAVAAARARSGAESVRIVVSGEAPGDALVGAARPGDVLVIGGPPRAGWWVRSGTTNDVMRRARCPVVVVPGPYGPLPRAGHVLVNAGPPAVLAFGFSYASIHGLPLVVVWGRPSGALLSSAAMLVTGVGGAALHPLGVTCRSFVAGSGCPVAVVH